MHWLMKIRIQPLSVVILCFCLLAQLSTAQELNTSQAVSEMLQTAQNNFDKEKYKEAIQHYLKVLQYNPSQKQAHIGLGKSFLKIKNFKKALHSFKQADYLFSKEADIKLHLAIVHLELGHLDTCESYLLKALDLKPNYPNAYLVYGKLYEQQQQPNQALQSYQYALILNPNYTQAYLNIGLLYLKQNKYQNSLSYLQKAQDSNPSNPLPHFVLAQYHYQKNQFVLSLNYLNRLLLIKPDDKSAQILLYQVLFRLEKWNEADHLLKELLDKYPGETKLYYYLALVKKNMMQLKQALTVIHQAQQKKLMNDSLSMLQDNILLQILHDTTNASLKKDAFIEQKIKEQTKYWIEKGIEFAEYNLITQAIFAFERAIKLDSNNIKTREYLAEIYHSKGYLWSYHKQINRIWQETSDAKEKEILDEQNRLAKRVVQTLLSNQINLPKLKKPEIIPKIIFVGFEPNYDFKHYAYFDEILASLFETASNLNTKLNVIFLDKNDQFRLEKIIQENNIHFILNASLKETDDQVIIELDLRYTNDGDQYKKLRIVHSEKDRFIYAAVEMARQLSQVIPIIGHVIQHKQEQLVISLGKKHGYQVGDLFYAVPSKQMIQKLLREKDLTYILSDKKRLYEYLRLALLEENKIFHLLFKEIYKLEIKEIDENIALTEIRNPNFLAPLSNETYVIHQPK